MNFLDALPFVLVVAFIAVAVWDVREQRKESLETARLPPKERHRRQVYLTYLPQSADDAKQLDDAIERGEL